MDWVLTKWAALLFRPAWRWLTK